MKISKYISTVLQNKLLLVALLLCCFQNLSAQNEGMLITTTEDTIRPSKYIEQVTAKPKLKFFQGFSVSADIFGPIQFLASDYGCLEGALRLNLKNTYLPIVEAGYAKCETTDENTEISYSTSAPYLRAGIDINFLKNKYQDNRLFAGLRYGFSTFKYDMSGPSISDPVWGGTEPFSYKDINATCHWAEIVIGVQVKIWKRFHMGWSIRYKQQLSLGNTDISKPFFVPGYGLTTTTSCWGGTYNLIFDLNWGKKKLASTEKK